MRSAVFGCLHFVGSFFFRSIRTSATHHAIRSCLAKKNHVKSQCLMIQPPAGSLQHVNICQIPISDHQTLKVLVKSHRRSSIFKLQEVLNIPLNMCAGEKSFLSSAVMVNLPWASWPIPRHRPNLLLLRSWPCVYVPGMASKSINGNITLVTKVCKGLNIIVKPPKQMLIGR